MAVPKKRKSRSKKNSRKATWIQKADSQARKAYSLARSILSNKPTSFYYSLPKSNVDTETN